MRWRVGMRKQRTIEPFRSGDGVLVVSPPAPANAPSGRSFLRFDGDGVSFVSLRFVHSLYKPLESCGIRTMPSQCCPARDRAKTAHPRGRLRRRVTPLPAQTCPRADETTCTLHARASPLLSFDVGALRNSRGEGALGSRARGDAPRDTDAIVAPRVAPRIVRAPSALHQNSLRGDSGHGQHLATFAPSHLRTFAPSVFGRISDARPNTGHQARQLCRITWTWRGKLLALPAGMPPRQTLLRRFSLGTCRCKPRQLLPNEARPWPHTYAARLGDLPSPRERFAPPERAEV